MITAAVRLVDRIVHVGVWASGALLIAAAVIIGVDVILRKLFGASLGAADEIAGYTLAILSAWAFSLTLLKRGHIRVDAAYNHLPARICTVLDLLALAAIALFIGVVTWYGAKVLSTSIALNARANTPLATPLWIPQLFWFAGLCTFMLTAFVLALAAIRALWQGDRRTASSLIGVHGAEEEVEAEMRDAEKILRATDRRPDEA